MYNKKQPNNITFAIIIFCKRIGQFSQQRLSILPRASIFDLGVT